MIPTLSRLALLICIWAVSSAAHASLFSTACVVHQTNPGGPDTCASNPDVTDSAANGSVVTADFNSGGVVASALAQVTAPLGLRASSNASVTGGFGGIVSAESRAIYGDTITLTSPGVAPGTPGTIDFAFNISGMVGLSGSGSAGFGGSNVQLIVNWLLPSPDTTADLWQTFKLGPADITVNETFVTKQFDVVYGVAVPIEFIFSATTVLSTVTGDVSANAGFASTVVLADIRGFDESAAQVPISLSSDAGFEYPISAAAPEPGTAVLLAFGLCGLGLVRTRDRTRL